MKSLVVGGSGLLAVILFQNCGGGMQSYRGAGQLNDSASQVEADAFLAQSVLNADQTIEALALAPTKPHIQSAIEALGLIESRLHHMDVASYPESVRASHAHRVRYVRALISKLSEQLANTGELELPVIGLPPLPAEPIIGVPPPHEEPIIGVPPPHEEPIIGVPPPHEEPIIGVPPPRDESVIGVPPLQK